MTEETPQDRPALNDGFYRQMLHQAAVAVVATDARFNIVCWNEAAEELLGARGSEMLGKRIDQAVPPARRKLLMKLVHRTAGGQASQFEIRLPDSHGLDRDLMVVLSPIPAMDGSPAPAAPDLSAPQALPIPAQGVAAWIVDQTHRKRLTERLAQAEKITSLGTLAGGVAHQFNNILGGVTTFVDFALTSGDPAAMRRALQMTAEAASRASKITQSLLSFAEQDSHRSDLADLTEVVLTFAHLVERPLTERNIQLQLDLKAVPIVAVEANRMHQVLGNLLTNSEEAMPSGGQVRIGLDRLGDQVRLTFSDTGCGIKHEHLPLVFEPFFTTKGLLAGGDHANPGLGLSVVHGIVIEMGARIEAHSKLGQGATFTIYFPLKTT
jgi:PAS domain S-box-containing protein